MAEPTIERRSVTLHIDLYTMSSTVIAGDLRAVIQTMLYKVPNILDVLVQTYSIDVTVNYSGWESTEHELLNISKNVQAMVMLADNPMGVY